MCTRANRKGCRDLWFAEGLDDEVADMLGVESIFSGVDFERLSRIVQVYAQGRLYQSRCCTAKCK